MDHEASVDAICPSRGESLRDLQSLADVEAFTGGEPPEDDRTLVVVAAP